MFFVLQTPSLQHLAETKLVAHLWSQRDILTQIAQSCNGLPPYQLRENTKQWKAIEEKVKSKVWPLPLPNLCKKKMLNVIKPIGMEIIAWCRYNCEINHNYECIISIALLQQLCWTMHGTVDYTKTAELTVKDESLEIENRYKLACINCIEDAARELIERIPEERRQEYVEGGGIDSMESLERRTLIALSTSALINSDEDSEQFHGDSRNKFLFKCMLPSGTRATCKYLFEMLNQEEKEQVLVECHIRSFFSLTDNEFRPTCNLMYYLSLMNAEQQERKFRECVDKLLIFFLRWPLQSLFMENAKREWQLMGEGDCAKVLNDIIWKILGGFQDYDYSHLFWECWRMSSADYQQHFLNDFLNLGRLMLTKREDFIELVLNQAPSLLIKELFCDSDGKISRVLLDESSICDAALMECKDRAASNSSNDEDYVEKRLRSQRVSRLVDFVMESRTKSREQRVRALVDVEVVESKVKRRRL